MVSTAHLVTGAPRNWLSWWCRGSCLMVVAGARLVGMTSVDAVTAQDWARDENAAVSPFTYPGKGTKIMDMASVSSRVLFIESKMK